MLGPLKRSNEQKIEERIRKERGEKAQSLDADAAERKEKMDKDWKVFQSSLVAEPEERERNDGGAAEPIDTGDSTRGRHTEL